MTQNLEKYSYEPLYQIKVKSELAYTILINGIPVINNYGYGNLYMGNNINNCIPVSGEQKLDVIIYPSINRDGTKNKVISNAKDFHLEIEETNWENESLNDPKLILKYDLPKRDNNGYLIDYDKLSVFQDSEEFKASVPYKLIDWRKGKTFKEKDSSMLKQKVVSFYKKLHFLYSNQKGEEYSTLIQDGLFIFFQSNYFDKKDAEILIQDNIDFINDEKIHLHPIDNYKLEFFANGELLGLKRVDDSHNGEGVIRYVYKNDHNQSVVLVDDILLYCPEDDNPQQDFKVVWYMNFEKGLKQ